MCVVSVGTFSLLDMWSCKLGFDKLRPWLLSCLVQCFLLCQSSPQENGDNSIDHCDAPSSQPNPPLKDLCTHSPTQSIASHAALGQRGNEKMGRYTQESWDQLDWATWWRSHSTPGISVFLFVIYSWTGRQGTELTQGCRVYDTQLTQVGRFS